MTPGFVATELIIWLNEHKIIRPGYTTLQELVSQALSSERQRLGCILLEQLDGSTITDLDKLIERDDTLSRLAILRQDARDRWSTNGKSEPLWSRCTVRPVLSYPH